MTYGLAPWRRKDEVARNEESGLTPLLRLQWEMDELFNDLFRGYREGGPLARTAEQKMMIPRLDVVESEADIQIKADLPGMDEKDIEVTLNNGLLTLKGQKKVEREEKNKNYHLTERSSGSFMRQVTLPEDIVDAEKVTASFKKGVLTIVVPKLPQPQKTNRQIKVTGE